jgi:hypothetical protein
VHALSLAELSFGGKVEDQGKGSLEQSGASEFFLVAMWQSSELMKQCLEEILSSASNVNRTILHINTAFFKWQMITERPLKLTGLVFFNKA